MVRSTEYNMKVLGGSNYKVYQLAVLLVGLETSGHKALDRGSAERHLR